jgi:hypothetical protein
VGRTKIRIASIGEENQERREREEVEGKLNQASGRAHKVVKASDLHPCLLQAVVPPSLVRLMYFLAVVPQIL